MRWGVPWVVVATAATSIAMSVPAAQADTLTPVGNGVVDTSRPGVAARNGGTTIVWTSASGELKTRAVTRRGRLGSTRVLERGWTYLSADPVPAGSEYVAAGTRALPGSGLYWPGAAFATDGRGLRSLSDDYAYLSQGQDAIWVAGRLLYANTDGGQGVQLSTAGNPTARVERGTASEPALAADADTTYVGWYSQGEGFVIADVAWRPGTTTVGQPVLAPGSQYAVPAQRVPLVVRKGQPWTAYQSGARLIRVWQPAQDEPVEVVAGDPVVAVDLAVAGARLWLAYATTEQICVLRSAPGTAVFGTPTCRSAQASGVAVAAGEAADVVATVAPRIMHARLSPGLSVSTRSRVGVVVVRDAGQPVAKARVTVGKQKARTNAVGRARLQSWPKKQRVLVRADGYEPWGR